MTSFEQRRAEHRARATSLLPGLLAQVDWPRERLDRHRERMLRQLFESAARGSSWHRERFRVAGIEPRSVREADLAALPTMTKRDLMENFDAIATDERVTLERCESHIAGGEIYMDDEFVVLASGGTSGVRAIAVSDWEDMARCFAANLRLPIRWGARTGNLPGPPTTASVTAAPGPHASRFIGRIFGANDQAVFSVSDPLAEIVDGLNRVDPDFLIVYSSLIPTLLAEFEAGRLGIRPKALMPAAEPFLPEHDEAVARIWQCGVFASWAATEVGLLAVGSGFESGVLLADDLAIVEPVDAGNRPAKPGERAAKVLVTPLYRRALPVIRYELTDQLTPTGGAARCGSSFARSSVVEGRLDDQFEYEGGLTLHPHLFRTFLAPNRAIREYQVRQTPRGAHVRFVADSPVDVDGLSKSLVEALERNGLRGAVVHAERTSSIERSGAGAKLRRFVPLPR